jgi:uncharacterized protein YggE
MNNSLKLVGVSILTLAILTGCLPSNTTSPSLSSEQANDFITVVGTGTATGVPDMATIYFGVNVVNNDLSSGVTEGNALMEGVSDALAEQCLG